ncbi:hypothetical protein ACWCPQ_16895 [Nocardia sp. NPDC001965]
MIRTLDPYVVEEDISTAEIQRRRRPGTRAATISEEETNLIGEYFWLAEDGLPFEIIARRLGKTVDALEQTLHRAGLHHRTPERAAVDRALDALIARGDGYQFTSDDLPQVDLATISHVLKTAKSAGRIQPAGKTSDNKKLWIVCAAKEDQS